MNLPFLLAALHAVLFAPPAAPVPSGISPGIAVVPASPLPAGDHVRKLLVDGLVRRYSIHIPPGLKPDAPAPVVLLLHGAAMNAELMVQFCGMNAKSDAAGFVAVYPNGTGTAGLFLTWNAGGLPLGMAKGKPDDVRFLRALLDDLATVVPVDPVRVHAAGLSNGGMMCYRLAAEMSDRIASIAPVAGTNTIPAPVPLRPVPVLHFHGTSDAIVPFAGPPKMGAGGWSFASVADSLSVWRKLNACPEPAAEALLPDKSPDDGTTASRKTWGPGTSGAEVGLVEIKGGGHTWPGQVPLVPFIGKSSRDISANDIIWEFFQRHPWKPAPTP